MHQMALSFFLCGSFFNTRGAPGIRVPCINRYISISLDVPRKSRKTPSHVYTRPSLRTLTRPCLSLEWRFTPCVRIFPIFIQFFRNLICNFKRQAKVNLVCLFLYYLERSVFKCHKKHLNLLRY